MGVAAAGPARPPVQAGRAETDRPGAVVVAAAAAGATGGSGGKGTGADIADGGSGGATAGASGGNGSNGPISPTAGGGGGGGAHGAVVTTSTTNSAALAGGNGGNGGDGIAGAGGGGGAGGYGVVVSGGGLTYANSSTIAGGNGGTGGSALGGGAGGNGGGGGYGIDFTGSGTLDNSGSIAGGNGGSGGAGRFGGTNGTPGFGGVGIVGSGLTITNSGTITGGLSGDRVTRANAITLIGGTNVVELQAGSVITGNVVGTGSDTFRLGGATNSSFDVSNVGPAAQYQGFGSFVKTGASIWTLTGTNAAALPWTINAGTLDVNGTMTNATMTVNAGGTLGGSGTVGNTTVNGGTFSPGSGVPGTSTTIIGNLAFQSGAIYLIQLNPSTASFANVSGTATLGGATVNAVFASGSYLARQYTILTAPGGVSGTFGSLNNSNLPAGFVDRLSYSGTSVVLNLTAVLGQSAGLQGNQQNVANSLNNFFNSGGAMPLAVQALFGLTGTSLAGALTQASGESATASQQTTFNAMSQFMGLLTDPFMGRGGGVNGASSTTPYAEESASAYAERRRNDAFAMFTKAPPAPFVQRWSVWAAGYGGSQSTDGNAVGGSSNTTSRIFGTAVGADYLFSPNTIAGFALAGGGTNFRVNNLGSGRSDLFLAGAYIRHTDGAAYITGALAYGWQDITTNRNVTIAGLDQLRAEFNANAWSGRVEGGYRFVAPWVGGVGITPYAAGQFTTFDLPAYAESVVSGTPAFALSYAAKSVTDSRSELGLRTDKSFAIQTGVLTLRGRLAWAHDFNPDRSIAATFQALPGASFVVNGAAQASDSALTTASAEWKWLNGWSAAGTFEGEFSNVTRSYAGKGVVRYAW